VISELDNKQALWCLFYDVNGEWVQLF